MSAAFSCLIHGGETMGKNGPIPLPNETIIRWQEAGVSRLRKLAQQAPPNGNIALERCGHIFEQIVRELLVERGFDLRPHREMLYYENNQFGRRVAKTRELDAVILSTRNEPQYIVECRVSIQGMSVYRKERRQLLESLALMRPVFPQVQGVVVLINVGPEPVQSTSQHLRYPFTIDHGSMLRAFNDTDQTDDVLPRIPMVVMSINRLARWAEGRGWEFHDSLLSQALRFADERWVRRAAKRRILH